MKILRTLWVLVLALVAGFAVQAQRLSGSMTITNLTVTTINGYNADAVLTNSAAGKLDITNGTAVALSGSLTNVSVKGTLTYDLSDESRLSANQDYGMALDVGLSSTTAKARIRSVSTIADLVAIDPLTSDIFSYVKVLGYASAGDGGGGDFRRVLASSGSTNLGTFFKSTANATYAWERVTEPGSVNVKWFGAKGDGTTDDTAALQAAIDYAESSGGGSVFVPPSSEPYRISTLTVRSCELFGVRVQQMRTVAGNTILLQTDSPTNHAIVVPVSAALQQPNIHDLTIVGFGDVTTPNKLPISAVSSRYLISVSTNNAPTLATAGGTFPQMAFFYTSENRYLGSAAVTGIATVGTNCQVTLDSEWDNYATPAASGTLLDTSCKVVFSPLKTLSGNTYANPAAAGYAGIAVLGAEGCRIADVTVSKFHTGIYIEPSVTPLLFFDGTVKINYTEFAGMASATPQANIDFASSGVLWIQGGYYFPGINLTNYPAETVVVTNTLARHSTFGLFNPWQVSNVQDVRTDFCVTGYLSNREQGNNVGYMMLDNCVRYGLVSRNGYYGFVGGVGSHFGQLNVQPYFSTTNTTPLLWTNKTAVKVDGTLIPNKLTIDSLVVRSFPGGADIFEFAFDISGLAHEVVVGSRLGDLDGATDFYRSSARTPRWLNPYENNTAAKSVTGFYSSDGQNMIYSAGATNLLTISSNVMTTAMPLYVSPRVASTNSFSVVNDTGQPMLRVDDSNNFIMMTQFGTSLYPALNAGTVLAVNNNWGSAARSRIAVFGGSSGISSLDLGQSLNNGISYDEANEMLNISRGSTRLRIANLGTSISDNTATLATADASSVLELQSTNKGLLLPRLTAAPGSPADGLLWYRSDTDVLALRANGATVDVAVRPATTALAYSGTNVTLTATSQVIHGSTLTLTNNCLLTITSSDGASGGITIVPNSSTSYTVYLDSAIKLLGGGSSFVVTNSASETVNLEWKQTLRGGSSVILANRAVYP